MYRSTPESRFGSVVRVTALVTTLVCLTTSGVLLAQREPPSTENAERQAAAARTVTPHGPCKVAGTWIGSSPPFLPDLGDQTLIFVETITPLDRTCQRFSTVLTPINPEFTFSGLFPEATTASSVFGTMTRTGPNEYTVSSITYFAGPPAAGAPVRGPIVYFWTIDGTVTVSCSDNACSEKLQDGILSLYSNTDDPARLFPPLGIVGVTDQDANDDGFADQGEVPLLAAPFPLASRRLGS